MDLNSNYRTNIQTMSQPSQTPQHSLDISDYECALCLKLLYNPISIPCGHSFCQFCLRQSMDSHLQGNPSTSSIMLCPLCRSPCLQQYVSNNELVPSALKPNVVLCQLLSHVFPTEYKARSLEVAQDFDQYSRTVITNKKLYIGNRHRLQVSRSDSNIHEWTFFARMETRAESEKYIEKVVVHLHPTFRPQRIELTTFPFEVRRLGWGIFQIRCEVHFKSIYHKPPLRLTWMLSFDDEGDFSEHDVQFSETVLQQQQQQSQELTQSQQELDESSQSSMEDDEDEDDDEEEEEEE